MDNVKAWEAWANSNAYKERHLQKMLEAKDARIRERDARISDLEAT